VQNYITPELTNFIRGFSIMEQIPESIHFVGVGGIGMSALAQMAASLGIETSGSDRGANAPENQRIIGALRNCGVKIYPQDGSRMNESPLPRALIYSTAIEEDNPDFVKGKDIPRLHRSEAMKLLVERSGKQILAVTGSCGKTSVTAWLAEALAACGKDPSMIGGGLSNCFVGAASAGNYHCGSGDLCVLEADESDKSLLNYSAAHALVLNIGTDHYSKEELVEVFQKFLKSTKETAVMSTDVFEALGTDCMKHLNVKLFSTSPDAPEMMNGYPVLKVSGYHAEAGKVTAEIGGSAITLPAPGIHNAANAAAVICMLELLGIDRKTAVEAAAKFSGVWRRFDFAGTTEKGVIVFDDYAHNVEKIQSCIRAAKEISGGRVLAIFQPHGFAPLRFMREELIVMLKETLEPQDVFAFLPVYYAGGTASFTPKSEEVAAEYSQQLADRIQYFDTRAVAEDWISRNLKAGDIAVVMGARDNSLSDWASSLGK